MMAFSQIKRFHSLAGLTVVECLGFISRGEAISSRWVMRRIELKDMVDLVYLASSSPFGATIMHFKSKAGENYYFILGGTRSETLVLYVKAEKEIGKRFVNLDASRNRLEYTDLPIIDPKVKVIPIIEVESQDLLAEGR